MKHTPYPLLKEGNFVIVASMLFVLIMNFLQPADSSLRSVQNIPVIYP